MLVVEFEIRTGQFRVVRQRVRQYIDFGVFQEVEESLRVADARNRVNLGIAKLLQ